MAALEDLLAKAERPMLILGGGRWSEAALGQIATFAERFGIPVCTSFRRAHHFHPFHPNYAGDLGLAANPKLVARVKNSDLVIAAGARLNELTSQGYSLFDIPTPQMTLVHAYPGAEELGRVYQAQLPIHASPQAFAAALEKLKPRRAAHDVRTAHQDYLDWSEKAAAAARSRQPVGDHGLAARASRRRRHRLQRRRQLFRLDPPLLSLPPLQYPDRHDLRLHGLWHAGGGGDEGDLSRTHGAGRQWRRRFPDERPGTRHRRAVQAAHHRRGAGQFHLRHHPHASGAGISRPRLRHRSGQSGFRRHGARLRRLRRQGGEDRRFCAGFHRRGKKRPAVGHPCEVRRRGHHADDDLVGAPRRKP